MAIIAMFICTYNASSYTHRYELNNNTDFELMLCIMQTGNEYCHYFKQAKNLAGLADLETKCVALGKKIRELGATEQKNMQAINACSAELAEHSNHYKAKLAKLNKSKAFWLGLTSVYLLDDDDESEKMMFCCNIIYQEFMPTVERFMHNAFAAYACERNDVLVKSNFIDVKAEEKAVTATDLLEQAPAPIQEKAPKKPKTPLVIKPEIK